MYKPNGFVLSARVVFAEEYPKGGDDKLKRCTAFITGKVILDVVQYILTRAATPQPSSGERFCGVSLE